MAGDWLKFEKATPDKPEVFAIAASLGIDPDAVVGKLMRVWSWFDTHTVDGNAEGVTPALLDRIAGVPGFVTAMSEAEWIDVHDGGVCLPNFDRHTGKTAKKRALTAKRVANHRSGGNGVGVTGSVTPALAREEKRREEKKELKSLGAPKRSPNGSRLEDDWAAPADWIDWAVKERPEIDANLEADKFRDFWHSKPGKDGRKADWKATWRNWIRNARVPMNGHGKAQPSGYQPLPGEV